MCLIFSAKSYPRCPQCNAISAVPSTRCRSWTLCNVEPHNHRPRGLQLLLGNWTITRSGDRSCPDCDRRTKSEQLQTIISWPSARIDGNAEKEGELSRDESARAAQTVVAAGGADTNSDLTFAQFQQQRFRGGDIGDGEMDTSASLHELWARTARLQQFTHQGQPGGRPHVTKASCTPLSGLQLPSLSELRADRTPPEMREGESAQKPAPAVAEGSRLQSEDAAEWQDIVSNILARPDFPGSPLTLKRRKRFHFEKEEVDSAD